MADSSECSICNSAEDTWRHALIDCNMAKCVWSLMDEELVEHLIRVSTPDARIWLTEMMDTLTEDDFVKVIVTLWAIWWTRRKAIHEQEYRSPLSTFSFVEKYLADLAMIPNQQKLGRVSVINNSAQRMSNGEWKPPIQGCMKLNVDAAVGRHADRGSCAVVYRDQRGVYMGASALIVEDMIDSEMLEAMAGREAMALASDLHLNSIHIATDCAATVNNLTERYMGRCSPIINDIQKGITDFVEIHIVHEKREHIWEAHDLAKSSVSLDVGRHLWLLNPPNFMCMPLSVFD